MTKCPACGAKIVAVVTHSLRIGRRTVQWSECVECILRRRELGDAWAQEAIREAERSGV